MRRRSVAAAAGRVDEVASPSGGAAGSCAAQTARRAARRPPRGQRTPTAGPPTARARGPARGESSPSGGGDATRSGSSSARELSTTTGQSLTPAVAHARRLRAPRRQCLPRLRPQRPSLRRPGAAHIRSDAELLETAREASRKLHEAIAVRVVGQEDVIELMLVALLARGHALLVGVPGLAKTLLVASLAEALDLSFGRVQFTPDLLPADITGTDVLQEETDGGRAAARCGSCPGPSSTTSCSPTRSTARRRRRRRRCCRRCRSGA